MKMGERFGSPPTCESRPPARRGSSAFGEHGKSWSGSCVNSQEGKRPPAQFIDVLLPLAKRHRVFDVPGRDRAQQQLAEPLFPRSMGIDLAGRHAAYADHGPQQAAGTPLAGLGLGLLLRRELLGVEDLILPDSDGRSEAVYEAFLLDDERWYLYLHQLA